MHRKFIISSCLLMALAAAASAQNTVQTTTERRQVTTQNGTPATSTTTTTTTTQAPATTTTSQTPTTTQIQPLGSTAISQVRVVSHTIQAVDYRQGNGSTKVDFRGTSLMPNASGEAKVKSQSGQNTIDAHFEHLAAARNYGPEFLTYVLWAITPQGRPTNLGEVLPNNDGKAALTVTSNLQAFGLIVTAEPYFSVARPSDMVVLENVVRSDTKGAAVPIDAKFEALNRADYTVALPAAMLPATTADRKTPLELLQARNAVAIARASGADQYAPEAFTRAQDYLNQAEADWQKHQNSKALDTAARTATQSAEDARLLAIERRQQAQLTTPQTVTRQQVVREQVTTPQDQQAQTQAAIAQEQAKMARQDAEFQKTQSDMHKQQAEWAQQQAAQQRAVADLARQQAQTAEQRANAAEQDKEQMRQQLLAQLNQVLETRDTARGLVAEMHDVLFDTGRATLKPDAKVRLAKVAGIIEAYPDLQLQIEGYTDDTGSARTNQVLSERRAATVRDFLISQGVPVNNVVAQGFGEQNPVASNATPSGRQMNRRVDLVVNGEAIGNELGMNAAPTTGGMGGAVSGQTGTSSATVEGSSGTMGSNASGSVNTPAQPEDSR